jgi:hypothetical protein
MLHCVENRRMEFLRTTVPNFGEGQPVPEPISHRQENHNLGPMCNKEHP